MSRRLRALRERHKMTQEDVAERVGVSVDGYRHWEHGRSDGLLRKLRPTAAAFGLTVSELLSELGFLDQADIDVDASNLRSLTPSLWRRWLAEEYGGEVAFAMTRMLEGASGMSDDEIRWVAETVQRSLDMLRRRPRHDDALHEDSVEA